MTLTMPRHSVGTCEGNEHTRNLFMIMPQIKITRWCRPHGPLPGRDGAGPSASKGPTQATGSSDDLGPRGRRSRATGQRTSPLMTAVKVAQWNAEGIQQKKPELQAFLRDNNTSVICIQEIHSQLQDNRRFFVRGFDTFGETDQRDTKEEC